MHGRLSALRIWLLPFATIFGASLLLVLSTTALDAAHHPSSVDVWRLFLEPDPASAVGALSNAGEIVAAVLSIAITVAAIVVELASSRYTHRITELFVAEPINLVVTGFFVVTGLQSLWISLTFDPDGTDGGAPFVPRWGISLALLLLTVSLLILLPYFAFVFNFLQPVNILARIRTHTLEVVRKARGISRAQAEAVRGIEQLADMALNAMENKDKGVSMASVDALFQLTIGYTAMRGELDDRWYAVQGDLARNPDFVSMAPEVLADVSARRIWFEMKVLRQYQTLYNEALNKMRDINYVVAINTRRLGELAVERGDDELVQLVIKFFNTYLRATINARDVRTAYNVLNQYRLLGERLLDHRGGERAVEVARYFKYYGRISFDQKQPFVLETVAYDLCTLNETAFDRRSPVRDRLLRIFLEVDKESESEVQEASLRGVRKAQIKLATYYLLHGDEVSAREVYRDMLAEKPDRLASIRDELLAVQTREFWEISDRGQNFDYLSPERKAKMLTFFEWFGPVIPALPSRVAFATNPLDAPRAPAAGADGHPLPVSSAFDTAPSGMGEGVGTSKETSSLGGTGGSLA
jgi:hypothetical protein